MSKDDVMAISLAGIGTVAVAASMMLDDFKSKTTEDVDSSDQAEAVAAVQVRDQGTRTVDISDQTETIAEVQVQDQATQGNPETLSGPAFAGLFLVFIIIVSCIDAVVSAHRKNKEEREPEQTESTTFKKETRTSAFSDTPLQAFQKRVRQSIDLSRPLLDDDDVPKSIRKTIREINETLRAIQKETDEKELRGNVRRLETYFLPTYDKLIQSYINLMKTGRKGKNIKKTLAEIEATLPQIQKGFEQILEEVTEDSLLSVQVEAATVKNVMQNNGLLSNGGMVFAVAEEQETDS